MVLIHEACVILVAGMFPSIPVSAAVAHLSFPTGN